jgi:MFS family permease
MRIIKLTSALIIFIPLFWLLNHSLPFLCVSQIFSGFVWAGLSLSTTNFIFDASSSQKRTRCIAYFNVINGFMLFAGALVGGYLAPKLPALFGYKLLSLFLLSACLRAVIVFLIPFNIKEVKPVQNMGNMDIFFNILKINVLKSFESGSQFK